MGEFRIGRSRAQHSYPDTRGAAPNGFARNSALGPDGGSQALPDKIKWGILEVGTVGGTVVPITPRVTGIIRIIGSVVCENEDINPNVMKVVVFVDGVSLVTGSVSTIDAAPEAGHGFITIPIEVDLAGVLALSTGVTHTIEVQVVPLNGGTSTSVVSLSALDIQELPVATG
jgi:hypothetical protein